MSLRAAVPLCLVWCAACTDLNMNPAVNHIQTAIDSPSFRYDIMPVLRATCGSADACHGGSTPVLGLNLEDDSLAWATSVNQPSINRPMPRVTPLQADSSFLYRVIQLDSATRLGYYRMPLTELALPLETRETIKNWINKGALYN